MTGPDNTTPGPWRASRRAIGAPKGTIAVHAVYPPGMQLAGTIVECVAIVETSDNSEENALLIAAAPDLWNALAAFVPDDPFVGDMLSGGPACVGCGNDHFNGHMPKCRWVVARAALTKAGKSGYQGGPHA